jgi:hypothetical protein
LRGLKIGPAPPDRDTLDAEVMALRDLDTAALRGRWQTVFRRRPPPHLPRHLLYRVLAYRLQADQLGDLDAQSQQLLDQMEIAGKATGVKAKLLKPVTSVRPGTVLGREWNGQMHRVAVLADGFAWNGKSFPSLSAVALAITGTRWNGPRFFALRQRATKGASAS